MGGLLSRRVRWTVLPHMIAQPWNEPIEAELVGVVKGGDENVGLLGVRREVRAVDGQKRIRRRESSPLVTVNERMVLREAFPKTGGLQQPWIPYSMRAAITFDLIGVHGQHFGHREIPGHSASFL